MISGMEMIIIVKCCIAMVSQITWQHDILWIFHLLERHLLNKKSQNNTSHNFRKWTNLIGSMMFRYVFVIFILSINSMDENVN